MAVGKPLGHFDRNLHVQVAAAASWMETGTSGMPRPRSVKTSPGCVPGGTSTCSGPLSVGTLIDAPSEACE